jgi:hypothetical protein
MAATPTFSGATPIWGNYANITGATPMWGNNAGLITGYTNSPAPTTSTYNPGSWEDAIAAAGSYGSIAGQEIMSQFGNPAGGTTGTNAFNPASGTGSYFNGAAGGLGGTYGTGTSGGGSTPFSLNPTPTQGSDTTFGMVPGAIGIPPSVWQQEQQIPGVSAATTAETGNINSELAGQLSPGTTENLEDSAAARGLSLGQGGNTGLVDETLLKTLGLTQEELQQAGATNLNQFLSTSGGMQTSQDLAATIASSNATNAAAANPTLAAWEAVALAGGKGSGSSKSNNGSTSSGYNPTASGANTGYAALLQQMLAGYSPTSSDSNAADYIQQNMYSGDNSYASSNPTLGSDITSALYNDDPESLYDY